LQFKNENDELVTTIATDELGTKFSEVKENGTIEVEIPRLLFREGRYTLHYMISEKLSFNTPHQVVDYLQDAFTLTVIRGDYWHSGVLNRPKGFIQEASIKLV
jgi:lipopolysaccharide transport system ATP-binding protein